MKKGLLKYSLIWLICVGAFWLGLGRSAMGYSLLVFYLALPIAALDCSAISGGRSGFGGIIISSLFIGVMYMMAEYLTFSLLNMVTNSFARINYPNFNMLIAGTVIAFFGSIIGKIFRIR